MTILIAGTGNMGRALAHTFLTGGHTVRLWDRNYNKAQALASELDGDIAAEQQPTPENAEVVVLSVPYPANKTLAENWADALQGTVVVDICNPIDYSTMDSLVTPTGLSAAEEIAAAAPEANVVKAFNTTFSSTLLEGMSQDVFVAGDSEEACDIVAGLISDAGLRPIRAGALKHARALESFQLIHMKVQDQIHGHWKSSVSLAA